MERDREGGGEGEERLANTHTENTWSKREKKAWRSKIKITQTLETEGSRISLLGLIFFSDLRYSVGSTVRGESRRGNDKLSLALIYGLA